MRRAVPVLAAVLLAISAAPGVTEPVVTGVPFSHVSAETCGACHGPDGNAPKVDMSQGDCADCHAGSHEDGLVTVADAEHHAAVRAADEAAAPSRDGMVLIPAGPAVIGNDGREITEGKGDLDETPEHMVDLPAYYIDIYEVTNQRYKRFVDATGRRAPNHWKGGIPEGKENHPVVYVSWEDADAFCNWEGKRLPNELEWEKAARGPDGQVFPWGNRFGLDRANTPQRWASLKEKGGTMPVGSFENGKSPYGLYDMSGNVWEWTEDWYEPYPGNAFPNNFYGHKNKVLRGGSWYDCLSYGCGLSAPSYNRSRFSPKIRNNSFGFRCAADAPAEAPAAKPESHEHS